tara:strand:+ start:2507 stop:2758 length:252 start_codon:yes stop_codon:yes gene_type:complete
MKKWELQIKKAPVQYSGTCPKQGCEQFVQKGQECPLKLPAKGKGVLQHGCPMRIEGTTKDNLEATPPVTNFRPKTHNPFTDRD